MFVMSLALYRLRLQAVKRNTSHIDVIKEPVVNLGVL